MIFIVLSYKNIFCYIFYYVLGGGRPGSRNRRARARPVSGSETLLLPGAHCRVPCTVLDPVDLYPDNQDIVLRELPAMAKVNMVPELLREREDSVLNLNELTSLIDGGEADTKRRKMIFQVVVTEPTFAMHDRYFLSRDELFERGLKKSALYLAKCRELELNYFETPLFIFALTHSLPIFANEMMVLTIESQGTKEQKLKWLSNHQIIGTYAQTELGHGTNVRGLETTATYNPSTEEFVINTPSLTAMKWWPGSLGHTANHAVVFARLITKGVDHGIHPFIIQIRSLEDHTPLPGVTVGDIGPKMGYHGLDNGFLKFDNVRIPRNQMLMKYSKVCPDGTYVRPPSEKITYGTLVSERASAVTITGWQLARAVTIATRYSVVRRQGQPEPGAPETQVMDYQMQQYKLLPLIASAYGLILTGQYMMQIYMRAWAEIAEGNLESMPELHATSAGLKALATTMTKEGIEMCRLSCGGHGYSRSSGLPDLYIDYVPACTYEGDNTVMLLQAARYLNKLYSKKLPASKLPSNVSYLAADYPLHRSSPVRTAEQFLDPHIQLEAYKQRARRMVAMASKTYQEGLRQSLKQTDAWNLSTCDWNAAAIAHGHYTVLKAFGEAVEQRELSGNNRAIMEALCSIFALFGVVTYAGEFMADGYMSSEQLSLAKKQLYSLFKVVRKEAVPLVDAFDIPDEILNSVLGRYDGDVYTHLYQWALKAPRNKKKVHDVYDKYLKDLIKSKL